METENNQWQPSSGHLAAAAADDNVDRSADDLEHTVISAEPQRDCGDVQQANSVSSGVQKDRERIGPETPPGMRQQTTSSEAEVGAVSGTLCGAYLVTLHIFKPLKS